MLLIFVKFGQGMMMNLAMLNMRQSNNWGFIHFSSFYYPRKSESTFWDVSNRYATSPKCFLWYIWGQTSLDIHPLCNLIGCFPFGNGDALSSIFIHSCKSLECIFKEVYQSSPRCLPLQIFLFILQFPWIFIIM